MIMKPEPYQLGLVKKHSPEKIYSEGGIETITDWLETLEREKINCRAGYIDGRMYKSYVKYCNIWKLFYDKIVEK